MMKPFDLEPFAKRVEERGVMLEEEHRLLDEARGDLDALRVQLDDAISDGNVKLYKELSANAEEIELTIKHHERLIMDIHDRNPVKYSTVVETWDKYRKSYNKELVKLRDALENDFAALCKDILAVAKLQNIGLKSWEEVRAFVTYHCSFNPEGNVVLPDDDPKRPEVVYIPSPVVKSLTNEEIMKNRDLIGKRVYLRQVLASHNSCDTVNDAELSPEERCFFG